MSALFNNYPVGVPPELHPCEHMITLVSRRSDDSLRGPAKWYTDFHVMTCTNCREALAGLRALRLEIKSIEGETVHATLKLSDQRWQQVRDQMQQSD